MRAFFIATAIALTGCATAPTTNVESQFASSASIFTRVAGTWAYLDKSGKVDCKSNETISFSRDLSVATFKSTEPYIMGDGSKSDTVTYKVLHAQGNVITMFINGETRTTEGGDPVVWSLVLLDAQTFVWRRTDWPAGDSTNPRIRCDG